MLKPAIEGTVSLVNDDGELDRNDVKQLYRSIRVQHKLVTKMKQELNSNLYRSELDFKDIYQLINFVERLYNMSHSVEGCADMLRVMIAK